MKILGNARYRAARAAKNLGMDLTPSISERTGLIRNTTSIHNVIGRGGPKPIFESPQKLVTFHKRKKQSKQSKMQRNLIFPSIFGVLTDKEGGWLSRLKKSHLLSINATRDILTTKVRK